MAKDKELKIVYSTLFQLIRSVKLRGWCVHMVCLQGEGFFTYDGRPFHVKKHDAVVINAPQQVHVVGQSEDLKVEVLAAPHDFLSNQLPANNYGIGGSISLYDNPVIPLSEEDAETLVRDIHHIRDRIADTGHLFYRELIGGLALPLIYDLFYCHAKNRTPIFATDRSMYVVKELMALLESGRSKKYREVAYYAEQLNVTVKYLSNTVKRQTGKSVTYYIDRYTVPMIKEYLNNPDLSIVQIAEEMNFTTLSYFSRYVTKHLGMSPKAYRESLMPR
ncbi:AraC family transcriptional regulator [Bacteroides gallinaceum]|uniref:helix-turn-helix domain-containing protein n=1 Tax=Bacteroides gallinaceum TaxID=1462571 RepID=UPI001959D6FD|nr:helix-turn-helix domain-containing protein [Bacteroides gallinaceum]MBM6719811.1 AraC family transcriptional regulator [Bacteroides gallinaceum]